MQSARSTGAAVVLVVASVSSVSLLSQLLVQFLFIRTGHPTCVVLMRGAAAQLFSFLLGFGFCGVQPFAMGMGWRAAEEQADQ